MPEAVSQSVRTDLNPTMQTLFASVLQALWIGFDSFYLVFYCHEVFNDVMLTVAANGFNGAIFLGTTFALIFSEKIEHWLLLCIFSSARVFLQFSLAFLRPGEISILFLIIIGFCIGIVSSTLVTFSIKKFSGPHGTLLVSVIYACFAGGIFISSVLLEKEEIEIPVHPRTKMPLSLYPVNSTMLSNMHIRSRYPPTIVLIISAAFQGSSVYPFYSLWKSKNEQPTVEEEYHDINEENKDQKQILFLCCFIGLLVNGLFSFFPYFLFSYNPEKAVQIYFTVFTVAFVFGRVIHTAICRRKEHNVVLSLSFVLCGFSVCIYSFEPARVISSAIFGFGLSMINPVLTTYIGQLSKNNVHALICSFNLSPVIFPLPLTWLLNNFGPQLFTSINFIVLIITVFFFVWLLNVQSKMDKPEGENEVKIWRFFRGEGALKRTRSIRRFIGSIKGSIRKRQYRRMQGASSPLGVASPTSSSQLNTRRTSPNRLSPHSYGPRTYRSTQNRQKSSIEIEDESSSTMTISTPTT